MEIQRGSEEGQSLVECALFLIFFTGVFGFIVREFRLAWIQSQCAYLVFEKTHAHLTGRREPVSMDDVTLSENKEGVRGKGVGRCAQKEEVELQKLETAKW